MAGKCPKHLEQQFIADVQGGLTNQQLADKYGKVRRTVRSWKKRLRESGRLPDVPNSDDPYHSVELRADGNYADATSKSDRIKTLDQLLESAEVDTDTWQVRDWGVKKWEVGAKIKEGHLEWDDGGIKTGSLDYKGLGVQDLWSVWAKFIRKQPIALEPTIQPVTCPVTYHKPPRPERGGVKVALVGADAHFYYRQAHAGAKLVPTHDRRALSIFLQLAAYLKPDLVKLLGDWNDIPEATDKFLRSPDMRGLMQPALEEGHWYRRQIREACPDAPIEEHEGNHEKRVTDHIMSHLSWAYGLRQADCPDNYPVASIPYLLDLDKLGIIWVDGYPDDVAWINDDLYVSHGDTISSVPGNTASKVVREIEHSCIFGHIHRKESATTTKRTRDGIRTVEAHGVGCLCRLDEYGPPAKSGRNNWQQSVAIVEYTDTEQNVYNVEIRNGRLIWDGRVFEGQDYIDQLREDIPDWQW